MKVTLDTLCLTFIPESKKEFDACVTFYEGLGGIKGAELAYPWKVEVPPKIPMDKRREDDFEGEAPVK